MRKLTTLALLLALAACGKQDATRPAASHLPPSAPAPRLVPVAGTAPFAPPGRLGHYSSGDGSVGFILDRLGATPKIRLDGATEIVDFEPDGKTPDHTDFVNHAVHAFLRFEASGRVTFVRGADSKPMARDAGAESLRGGAGNVMTYPASPQATDPNPPKLRIGHYSSGDGMTGFILDRTGAKARMQLDGASGIVALDSEAAPFEATSLRAPKGGVVLRVGPRGEVEYYRGNESIGMRRDCDADPLP